VYGSGTESAPPVLASVIQSAFEMEEGQPQVAPIPGTDRFIVFESAQVTPSAAAPLAEIADDVAAAWRRETGAKAARAAADRILARVSKGASVAAAVAQEKIALPAPQPVNMTREELVTQGQKVPPPLALLFSMAKGSVKKLEAANSAGWYIVRVDTIEPGRIAADDPILLQAGSSLGQLLSREYSDALRVAVRKEAGIERNAAAIAAVRKQLAGGDSTN
jgi:peptidyl-prolyl cis-trans isomerase D